MTEIEPRLLAQAEAYFPQYVDSTMIACFQSCERKFWWTFLRNLVASPPPLHLHAGGAFSAGLCAIRRAYYERGLDEETSLHAGIIAAVLAWGTVEAPEEFPKTLYRVLEALTFYCDTWPLATDPIRPLITHKKATVEFSFALPLEGTSHPITGDPIIYCGRSDMIGVYNDALWIDDEKTTTQLGPTWSQKWTLRAQFTGYCWAAGEWGYNIAGSIIRGISFLTNHRYGHAEAITFRPRWQIDRWHRNTVQTLERMIYCWTSGEWRYALADACEAYGGCEFMRLCESEEPESWINPYFTQRVWNPLSHTEIIPEVGPAPLLLESH